MEQGLVTIFRPSLPTQAHPASGRVSEGPCMPQGSELEGPLLDMDPSCELKGNEARILTFSRCLCLGQVGQPALGHLVPGLRARSPSRDGRWLFQGQWWRGPLSTVLPSPLLGHSGP